MVAWGRGGGGGNSLPYTEMCRGLWGCCFEHADKYVTIPFQLQCISKFHYVDLIKRMVNAPVHSYIFGTPHKTLLPVQTIIHLEISLVCDESM